MAASPTPRPRPAEAGLPPVSAPLAALDLPLPLAVAYSGGADSTALLLAAAARWPGQVHALHIHHGLQPAADGFLAHCQERCARLGMPLHARRVDAGHAPRQSPEEAARTARYAALAAMAQEHGLRCVLLAQHADDQAESLLLALSRGAGLPGLAAMPADFERHGVRFLRPLLGVPGADLREALRSAGESWIDDPTNTDEARTRNRIRHRLLPALQEAFPGYREAFARSARHAAQAQELLDEFAASDLAGLGGEPDLAALQALGRNRQGNVLRHWLRRVHGTAPTAAQLDELLDQVAACVTRGHRIHLRVGAGSVIRDGPRLRYEPG